MMTNKTFFANRPITVDIPHVGYDLKTRIFRNCEESNRRNLYGTQGPGYFFVINNTPHPLFSNMSQFSLTNLGNQTFPCLSTAIALLDLHINF